MKKVLGILICSIILAGCSDSSEPEKETNDKSNETVTAASTKVNPESIDQETEQSDENVEPEITADLNGEHVWEYYSDVDFNDILESYDPEEKYIMFDEAAELEDNIIEAYSSGDRESLLKWKIYIDILWGQTEEYHPEQEEYFDILKQVSKEMTENKHDDVVNQIKEAKKVREANEG